MALPEPELLWGQYPFPAAQSLLAGAVLKRAGVGMAVGWHGTVTEPHAGAFAVVRDGAGLDDLIGEILRVSFRDRSVYVYCVSAANVPTDVSLARRAFYELGLLALEQIEALVEVIA